MIHSWGSEKKLPAEFYRTERGNEPVREWLRDLEKDDRRIIGADIMTVEYGWPIGMPTCRSRSDLNGRIARVLFCIAADRMVLLHGFFKKSQKTPDYELMLARDRKRKVEESR
jgi:phage-related protein